METNTPVPEVAQRKSIAQRILETRALEKEARQEMDDAAAAMAPAKAKYDALLTKWCSLYNKRKYLEDIAAEEEKEIAQ